jgi:hypothetical protein
MQEVKGYGLEDVSDAAAEISSVKFKVN